MDDNVLEYPWDKYNSLQKRSRQIERLDPTAWAIEAQLNKILKSVAERSLPDNKEALDKQMNNLAINRQKKHRNRSRILQEHAATAPTSSPAEPIITNLIQDGQLVQIRASTTTQELRILYSLAHDVDYKTVAQSEGLSVAALKTKVCRCRHRLRHLLAA
jgi:hypothetical protein